MTSYRLAIVVAIGLLGAWVAQCQGKREGRLNERIVSLERRNAYLEERVRVADTVYTTDTVRLTNTRWRTDSILLETWDTVVHRDTVLKLVWAERAACDSVIATCEMRVAYRDSVIANLDSLYKTEQKRGSPWLTKLGWLLAGIAAGSLVPR